MADFTSHVFYTNQSFSLRNTEGWKQRGRHSLIIKGHSLDGEKQKGDFIESSVWNVAGYNWTIKYYPKGTIEAAPDLRSGSHIIY